MSGYRTVVVGTDGSDSSLRAVDKAGQIAAGSGAKVIVATAYLPHGDDQRAADLLKDEGYKMAGNAPIYAILREASSRAKAAGANESKRRRSSGRRWTLSSILPRKSTRTCWWSATSGSAPSPAGCWGRCLPTSRAGPRPTC